MPLLPPEGTAGADLPVRAVLDELLGALSGSGAAVLVSPPGTGKTTLVPLALADQAAGLTTAGGRVVVGGGVVFAVSSA
nr:hypothetical protein [Micromonospora sp. DSM 115978]